MKGDIGMENYEKQVQQEAAYPILVQQDSEAWEIRQITKGMGSYGSEW